MRGGTVRRDTLNARCARAVCHSRNSLRADKYTTKSVNHPALDLRHTRDAHLCSIALCKGIHTLTCRSMLCEERYSLLFRLAIPGSSAVPATSESLRYRGGSWRNRNRIAIIDYDTLPGSTNALRAHGCTRLMLAFCSLSFDSWESQGTDDGLWEWASHVSGTVICFYWGICVRRSSFSFVHRRLEHVPVGRLEN